MTNTNIQIIYVICIFIFIFSLLFGIALAITNPVTYLIKLELTFFYSSKIFTIWKIDVIKTLL